MPDLPNGLTATEQEMMDGCDAAEALGVTPDEIAATLATDPEVARFFLSVIRWHHDNATTRAEWHRQTAIENVANLRRIIGR